MEHQHSENAGWAREKGYEFHAESEGVKSDGARGLDIFRKAEGFRDHVLGIHRNRPFEVLDVQMRVKHRGAYGFVWKTVVLVPTTGLAIPNFDLMPRRETGGMNYLGIKGLDLKLAPTAPPDERELVDAFNKNYSLFGGGAFEAMEASIKSAHHRVPSLEEMVSICKPGVLRFLSTAVTGSIEVQSGYLAIRAPETRIIKGAFSDIILQGKERESLLTVANDLLDVLANAAGEAPLRALTLENTFNPRQVLGGIIGGVVGFFLGGFSGVVLLFLLEDKHLFLIPALALGCAAIGHSIGKMLTRAK
jgi:hypothetical protein